MKAIGEDLSNTLLKGFSSCVSFSSYSLESRTYCLNVVDDPNTVQKERGFVWEGIRKFTATPNDTADFEDTCMDCVFGIHERVEGKLVSVLVQTQKYEIEFESERSVEVSDTEV